MKEEQFISLFNLNGYFYFKDNQSVIEPQIIINAKLHYKDLVSGLKTHFGFGEILMDEIHGRCQWQTTEMGGCGSIINFIGSSLIGARLNSFNKFRENYDYIKVGRSPEEISTKLREKADFNEVSDEEREKLKGMARDLYEYCKDKK